MKKQIIVLSLLVIAGLWFTAYASASQAKVNDKQVYCNQQGNSGTWKAQIANGQPNEHEYKLDGVFVHDQSDVTAAMDAKCQELYGGQPSVKCESPKVIFNERCVDPVPCPAGTTIVDYKDETKQEPICKDNPTGCPYGDSIPLGDECDKQGVKQGDLVPVTENGATFYVPVDPRTGKPYPGK